MYGRQKKACLAWHRPHPDPRSPKLIFIEFAASPWCCTANGDTTPSARSEERVFLESEKLPVGLDDRNHAQTESGLHSTAISTARIWGEAKPDGSTGDVSARTVVLSSCVRKYRSAASGCVLAWTLSDYRP